MEGNAGNKASRETATPAYGNRDLTPEFCHLVYDADPDASNDNYYVTSEDFLELHSKIRRDLLLGVVGWAVALLLVVGAMIYFTA